MKDLELRRETLEALGWRVNDADWWLDPNGKPPTIDTQKFGRCEQLIFRDAVDLLPAIESDNCLALDVLVKFCDERDLGWCMETNDNGVRVFTFTRRRGFAQRQVPAQRETRNPNPAQREAVNE